MERLSYYALILLSGLGTVAGGRLSLEHMQTGETCPMLGPVPACLVVFAGYAIILASVILRKKTNRKTLFYVGWTPIFLLAAMGVGLEIFGQDICPPGSFGIPQCFYSLTMVLICLILFLMMGKNKRAGI